MKLKKILEDNKKLKNEAISRQDLNNIINFTDDYHRKDLDRLREKMQDIIEILLDEKFKKTDIREYLYWVADITV